MFWGCHCSQHLRTNILKLMSLLHYSLAWRVLKLLNLNTNGIGNPLHHCPESPLLSSSLLTYIWHFTNFFYLLVYICICIFNHCANEMASETHRYKVFTIKNLPFNFVVDWVIHSFISIYLFNKCCRVYIGELLCRACDTKLNKHRLQIKTIAVPHVKENCPMIC